VNRVRTAVVAVVASAAAASVTTVATAAPAKQHDESIVGTWTVYVTPSTDAPFESTMAFAPGGEVMEATSRAPMSAGLGAWSHTGRGPIYVMFSKYRFDSAGNYIGKVTIHDVGRLSGTGDTYDGQATTVITNTAGVQVATFASVSHATRVTP